MGLPNEETRDRREWPIRRYQTAPHNWHSMHTQRLGPKLAWSMELLAKLGGGKRRDSRSHPIKADRGSHQKGAGMIGKTLKTE